MSGLSAFVLSLLINFVTSGHSRTVDSRCEPMRIPWCVGAYGEVTFPNFFGHKTQEEAYYAMHKLWPLIQSGCSAEIGTYLCRLYAPQCPYLVRGREAEYVSYYQPEQVMPPCEEACLRVKRDCQRVLRERGMEWPPELDCHRLKHKDCRPTVEVRPTEAASKGRIDWGVETAAPYTPTPRSWRTPPRPSTTVATSTSSTKAPSTTTTEPPRVIYQTRSTTHQPSTKNLDTTPPAKLATVETLTTQGAETETTPESSSTSDNVFSTTHEVGYGNDTVILGADLDILATGKLTDYNTTGPEAGPAQVSSERNATLSAEGQSLDVAAGTDADTFTTVISTSTVDSTSTSVIVTDITTYMTSTTVSDSTIATTLDITSASSDMGGSDKNSNAEDESKPLRKPFVRFKTSGEVSSDEIGFYPSYEPTSATCEPLTVPSCRNLGYNATNIDEETQNLAAIQIFYFSPLVQEVRCSDYLQPFLCAAYAPPCKGWQDGENVMPPCRSFCETARRDCEELIEKLGFRWPEELECHKYPVDSDQCIGNLTFVEEEDEDESLMPAPVAAVRGPGSLPEIPEVSQGLLGHLGQHAVGSVGRINRDQARSSTELPRGLPRVPDLVRVEGPATTGVPSPTASNTTAVEGSQESQCEPIIVERCRNLPAYSTTKFPNLFGHLDQFEAAVALREFEPLIKVKCGEQILLFLCSVYVPPCRESESTILPCRGLCEEVRGGCAPLLKSFGFAWPPSLNCSQFPADPEPTGCIRGSDRSDRVSSTSAPASTSTTPVFVPVAKTRALTALRETALLNSQCREQKPTSTCADLYDKTYYPNILGHARQEESEFEMVQFQPLITINCSPQLKSFLCSVYSPRCTVLDYPVPPCREVCIEAKKGCESVMNSFGFLWPSHLNCTQYPVWESTELCWNVVQEAEEATTTTPMVFTGPNRGSVIDNSSPEWNVTRTGATISSTKAVQKDNSTEWRQIDWRRQVPRKEPSIRAVRGGAGMGHRVSDVTSGVCVITFLISMYLFVVQWM